MAALTLDGIMFERLRANQSVDFAIGLAEEFSKRFPPEASREGASAKAFARTVDDLCARVQAYQREQKPGLYGKAKFGTEFKHRLKDLGYPRELVDELTGILLVRMSGR